MDDALGVAKAVCNFTKALSTPIVPPHLGGGTRFELVQAFRLLTRLFGSERDNRVFAENRWLESLHSYHSTREKYECRRRRRV